MTQPGRSSPTEPQDPTTQLSFMVGGDIPGVKAGNALDVDPMMLAGLSVDLCLRELATTFDLLGDEIVLVNGVRVNRHFYELELGDEVTIIWPSGTTASLSEKPQASAVEPSWTANPNCCLKDIAIPKPKRSTERNEGRIKLIATLTKHHDYANGSCLNQEPLGNNRLARLAKVSTSTASMFFNKQFGSYKKYRAACGDVSRLVGALKLLNQEFSPHHFLSNTPLGDKQPADEE